MTSPGVPSDVPGPLVERAETARADRTRLSIRSFITDGSLGAMCEQLGGLSGLVVQLRDERGLVLAAGAAPDDPGIADPLPEGALSVPLVVDGERIGASSIAPGLGTLNEAGRRHLETAVSLLGQTAAELCTDVTALRTRVSEIALLYRLSAMIADGGRVEDTLVVALSSALDVLGLDCGSVVLLPEDADGLAAPEGEEDLALSASFGLSEEWLSNPLPLSANRVFDRLALAGEVVAVPDLLLDSRVLGRDRCEAEGVRSFLNAGLVFAGRPLGVIRLYGRTARNFRGSDRRLIRSIGQQAAAAVEQGRLLQMRARERRTQRALRLAGAVQQRMLPRRMPELSGLSVAARFIPSYELGGDFFDAFERGGRLGVVVGDVVGKGVAAALLMSAVRATLRAHAEGEGDVARVMGDVNRALCRDTTASEFATLFFGEIDPRTGSMVCCSAGHEPAIIHRAGDDRIEELEPGGLVVGVDPGEVYGGQAIALRAGDTAVLYSDGVPDAQDFAGKRFGRDRFRGVVGEVCRELSGRPAQEVLERLLWTLRQFQGLAPQADDLTLVVVRRDTARDTA